MALNILVTGGNGRLCTELKKVLPQATYVDIQHYDLAGPHIPKGEYDLIIHAAAYTDVKRAEEEPRRCYTDNVVATANLVRTYFNTPFIYISTEYANKPLGWYARTKRAGEEVVKTHPKHLIVRTSFKPNPWPFPFAYENQYTQGDYVDVIASGLADMALKWNMETSALVYLGTGRKTILELARRTRADVSPNRVEDYNKKLGMELIPTDYLD